MTGAPCSLGARTAQVAPLWFFMTFVSTTFLDVATALTEVVEAVEVIEAAKVPRPGKLLLMTVELSRFLNSAQF